jgi:NAD+ synthase (glutamine-hydrolysing)
MPSPHSSPETQQDARNIGANLGVELLEIPIEAAMAEYRRALAGSFGSAGGNGAAEEPLPRDPTRSSEPDLAAENIQARIRGNMMMALSNKHGWLVLTTGNKSEMSVGYATLYGDMAGGFAAIKDVPKTGREEMIAAGMPAEVVDEVVRMVDRSEYKRRQAAPGIRITPKAFGRDRRLPITNRFGG